MLLPSSTLSSLEKKLLLKSSVFLRLSLTFSFPHSPRTVGPSTNLQTAPSTTSHSKTSQSRTFPCPLLKRPLPLLLPLPHCHLLLNLSLYFTPPLTSGHLSTSSPPHHASLPTTTLISTQFITNKVTMSGSHQRNLLTVNSSTISPGPKTSIPPHPYSLSPSSAPMPTTPSTSTLMACSPLFTSVPK